MWWVVCKGERMVQTREAKDKDGWQTVKSDTCRLPNAGKGCDEKDHGILSPGSEVDSNWGLEWTECGEDDAGYMSVFGLRMLWFDTSVIHG